MEGAPQDGSRGSELKRVALLRFAERFLALQQTTAQRDAVYFDGVSCQFVNQ
jgi:hypothetical protein